MSNTKKLLAALTIFGAALCAAPALAIPYTPVTVSNVQVNWSQGMGTNANTGGIYYAGPITFTIGGLPVTVWCDDFDNAVYIGSSNPYFQTDTAGANAYLVTPSLNLSQQTLLDKQIAGLAYKGTMLSNANTLTSSTGAQYQMAIWELQNPALLNTDIAFQTAVNALIGLASSYYDEMVAAGYTYGQLVSPSCGQDPATLTHTSACQTQGQIFVSRAPEPPTTRVPEPISLSLFGAGLAGAFVVRRRKATAA